MQFTKYHALGNDYLVVKTDGIDRRLTPAAVRRICHRHYGIGSDGILVRGADDPQGRITLRIFNPDGSEAEKSGNGLRIFARYLWDTGVVRETPFPVLTQGGLVTCQVLAQGQAVTVEMGHVSFTSTDIPVLGPPREVLREILRVDGQAVEYSAATLGNPHCVILRDHVSEAEARRLGPLLETHEQFPQRTNVQFMAVLDRSNIRLAIWERGAGYTLASGSSSCAAAAVAYRLGLCDAAITVHMPGGQLTVELSEPFAARLTGPVVKVGEGVIAPEALADVLKEP
ncbi:MAG: diaminopimelate epimerase [Anaerolineae bacterium]|nr:diaminopimelate epimerase [Anaerolineae bacterium]